MGLLEEKVAIVTGAGSGIGRATCRRLAAEGAAVVAADIVEEAAQETVEDISGIAVRVDVADEASVAGMVDAAVSTYGRIDALHNNAANIEVVEHDRQIHNMDVDVWEQTMAVNLRGPMLGAKHVLPHMIGQGSGSIVNTSSTQGQIGDLTRVAYGVSKGAVEALTRNIATCYGRRGIRCNAIAPSVVRTPSLARNVPAEHWSILEASHLTPYIGEPEDIAAAVAFLVSDESRFVTGQVLNLDGGWLCHNPTYASFTRPKVSDR